MEAEFAALTPRARSFFDAHLKFELSRLDIGDGAQALIAGELETSYDWLVERNIDELFDVDEVFDWIRRRILQHTPTPESAASADAVAGAVCEALAARTETIGDLLSGEAFDLLLADLSEDAALRDAVVDGMVHNAVFSTIISEILYHGIADFMSESKLTNSIPGAQSLFKLGQNLLNTTAPGLKDGFEKTIKEFIKNNAGQIIKDSEASVKKSLSPAVIRQAAEQFRAELDETQIRELTQFIAPEKIPSYRKIGDLFGTKLRASPLVGDLILVALNALFDSVRDRKAADLLRDLGIDRDVFLEEGRQLAAGILRRAQTNGLLENLVTRRLLAFYISDEAAGL